MNLSWALASTSPAQSDIFVEDWAASYGSPYLVQLEETDLPAATLIEDGEALVAHRSDADTPVPRIAFVDGVRRVEGSLYQVDPESGAIIRGLAGAFARGAVTAGGGANPEFVELSSSRVVVWGSDADSKLPPVPGGWRWTVIREPSEEPDAPMKRLQSLMRDEEGKLADKLCSDGQLVLVDGPLNFVRERQVPVVGYVKTHHRALLPLDYHRRIPDLQPSERTSAFTLPPDRFSCYLRIAPTGILSGPWSGIVRLEMPQAPGLNQAIEVFDMMAGVIPRFAGAAHIDPRAPQNLQPIGALETRLRHMLGDLALASRALRHAALAARTAQPVR